MSSVSTFFFFNHDFNSISLARKLKKIIPLKEKHFISYKVVEILNEYLSASIGFAAHFSSYLGQGCQT